MAGHALPAGVVTFLMSDVEGSSKHWAAHPTAMAATLRNLDTTIDEVVGRNDGAVIAPRGEGDSHFAVFTRPSRAVLAACELQVVLGERSRDPALRVRVAVHTGEVDPREGDYYGVTVNQTARLRSLAHGEQTVVSRVAARLAEHTLEDRVQLRSLGHHKVRDFPRLEEIFQATLSDQGVTFPPLRTESTRGPAIMTVVIVDVCDASNLATALDSAEFLDMQRRWNSVVRNLGEQHRVASLKLLGDGAFLAFEDPLDGLDFTRDLRTSLAETAVQIRSAVAAGRVELADGEVIGESVFVAAGLVRGAQPGEIAMTAAFRELAGIVNR